MWALSLPRLQFYCAPAIKTEASSVELEPTQSELSFPVEKDHDPMFTRTARALSSCYYSY